MDPQNSPQDVIHCAMCEIPVPPLYCEVCHINLCKTCAGEHLLDESKFHIVVPIKYRKFIPKIRYPKCKIHTKERCNLQCEQCDIPVCVRCVSSKKHETHHLEDISKIFERKNEALQKDLEELGKCIYPLYQEIASSLPVQMAELKRNTEKLISAISERGDEWHREIDNIIRNMKLDIKETESEHIVFLKKQEDDINQTISEIRKTICELKKLKDLNDVSRLSQYKSRNAEFGMLAPKFNVTLPNFSSERINTDQLIHQFGSLEALSITTEDTRSKNTRQRRRDLKLAQQQKYQHLFETVGTHEDTEMVSKDEVFVPFSMDVDVWSRTNTACVFLQPHYVPNWM